MTTSDPLRLLVADDNDAIRALVRLVAATRSIEVVGEARNVIEAICLADDHDPDVIVLDVRMPHMDGTAALPALGAIAPRSQIVVYSAEDELRERCLALGAHAWVDKLEPWTKLRDAILQGRRG